MSPDDPDQRAHPDPGHRGGNGRGDGAERSPVRPPAGAGAGSSGAAAPEKPRPGGSPPEAGSAGQEDHPRGASNREPATPTEEPAKEGGEGSGQGEKKGSPPDEKPPDKKKHGPSKRLLVIGLVVLALAGYFGFRFWQFSSHHETTDDAYVTGHTHQLSSRVAGTVTQVRVDDNQHVARDQVLVSLDPRDYEVALQRAEGGLRQARAQVGSADAALAQARAELLQRQAQVAQSEAQVTQAEAQFQIANINYTRNSSLYQRDLRAVAKADVDTTQASLNAQKGAFDAARATLQASQANVEAAKANEQAAQAQRDTALAIVGVNEAAVADARLQLSYCQVVAPVDGRIARKTVESGNRISPGQSLMAVVEDNVWVVANFKETQLERIEPGQAVNLHVDALPHHDFTGKVDSIQPGSGSTFALLPTDNATGNFTKIVQRVPVKIVFNPESLGDLRDKVVPGLSVVPSIVLDPDPKALHAARDARK